MMETFFVIRHFSFFSLSLNSINWSEISAASHWKKLSNKSEVMNNKNNLNTSKYLSFVCLFFKFWYFFSKNASLCHYLYIYDIERTKTCSIYREIFFKEINRFQHFILWVYCGYIQSKQYCYITKYIYYRLQ